MGVSGCVLHNRCFVTVPTQMLRPIYYAQGKDVYGVVRAKVKDPNHSFWERDTHCHSSTH